MHNLNLVWFNPKYLNVKRISSRDSRTEWNQAIKFGNWLKGNLGNFVEDKIQFSKSLLLQYDDPTKF
jgi:hypothetical protein